MLDHNGQLILIADPLVNRRSYYKDEAHVYSFLEKEIRNKNVVYTSLLPGPETTLAECAFDIGVPYIASVPYKQWHTTWTRKERNNYSYLLKRAAKIFYIDRQPKFISDRYPPDVYDLAKIGNQIKWLTEKALLFPKITQFVTYVNGLHSYKSRTLQFELNKASMSGKWHLKQKTNMHIVDPEDDLPF